MASPSTLATARLTTGVPRSAPPHVATLAPPLNCSLQCSHFQSNRFSLLAILETSLRDFTEALSSAMASLQGPPVSPSYKQVLLTPVIPSEHRSEDDIPVRKVWKRLDMLDVSNRTARSELVQSKIRELKWLSSPTNLVCFRCGDRSHIVSQCRNAVLCFACNRSDRSVQCKAITETVIPTPVPSAAPIPNSNSISVSVRDSIKRLEMELVEIKQELALMKKSSSAMEIGMACSMDRDKGSRRDASHSQGPIMPPSDSLDDILCEIEDNRHQQQTGGKTATTRTATVPSPGETVGIKSAKTSTPQIQEIFVPAPVGQGSGISQNPNTKIKKAKSRSTEINRVVLNREKSSVQFKRTAERALREKRLEVDVSGDRD